MRSTTSLGASRIQTNSNGGIRRRQFDRSRIKPGIVHFGPGRFFLAHLGDICDELLERETDWGIRTFSFRTTTMVNALAAAGGEYGLIERQRDERRATIIGSVLNAAFGPDDPKEVFSAIANGQTRVVTMTVTQNGYGLRSLETGELDTSNEDISADLTSCNGRPRTVLGYLVRGLGQRARNGGEPINLLSLDNLPGNGNLLYQALVQMAEAMDREAYAFLKAGQAQALTTTIDRITPAATPEFQREAEGMGLRGLMSVGTETFRQLVVQRGEHPMPDWDGIPGVHVVPDVAPFWMQKFFGLNCGHTVAATAAQRCGHQYIFEAASDPTIEALLRVAHQEMAVFLGGWESFRSYSERTVERFQDHALRDTVDRVGAEGSRKIPKYALAAIAEIRKAGGPVPKAMWAVVATWLANLSGVSQGGGHISLNDPKAEMLMDLRTRIVTAARRLQGNPMDENLPQEVAGYFAAIGDKLRLPIFRELAGDHRDMRELLRATALIDAHEYPDAVGALLSQVM